MANTTSPNPAAKPKAAKPDKAAKLASAGGSTPEADVVEVPELRRKQLVFEVAQKTGVSKKVAREVIDAAMSEIGAALSRGEGLNLPPLGKAKVNRQMERGSGEILVIKLRRSGKVLGGAADDGEEILAEPAD